MTTHLYTLFRVVCAGVLALCCALASAQSYRWTDPATGRTVYSDVPPAGKVKGLTRINRGGGTPVESEKNLPYAARVASQKYPVTLYTSADCAACNDARQLLSRRSVPFTEKTVQSDAEKQELKNLIGDSFVPALKVGAQRVRGYNASAYDNILDLAGYPKATADTTSPDSTPAPKTPASTSTAPQ
ncbi:MAG: glutaredoxin family protein [Zoogloeaceae bacterium]|jgi:glutaredoxin|nr:glutaredoxin family protein [Zoogloeaceae bacterium]